MPVGGNGFHLFVVCTEPCANRKVVLVNISSWKGAICDGTVRLQSGVHPFINKDSYAVYQYSEVERCITVEAGEHQGRYVRRESFPEPYLTEVFDGIARSRFTPRKVKKYLEQ